MTNGAPTTKSSTARVVAIVLAVSFGLVVVLGILAAIAIPAYVDYIRRAKTSEAYGYVQDVARGVARYRSAERVPVDPGARTARGRMPPSLPRTPAAPSCEPAPWPADADPGWAEIGFAPAEPLRFAYELRVAQDGASFTARAVGDLDCDGVTSLFEVSGAVDPTTGEVTLSPPFIRDETE